MRVLVGADRSVCCVSDLFYETGETARGTVHSATRLDGPRRAVDTREEVGEAEADAKPRRLCPRTFVGSRVARVLVLCTACCALS